MWDQPFTILACKTCWGKNKQSQFTHRNVQNFQLVLEAQTLQYPCELE